jgi:hypothetical protein
VFSGGRKRRWKLLDRYFSEAIKILFDRGFLEKKSSHGLLNRVEF